ELEGERRRERGAPPRAFRFLRHARRALRAPGADRGLDPARGRRARGRGVLPPGPPLALRLQVFLPGALRRAALARLRPRQPHSRGRLEPRLRVRGLPRPDARDRALGDPPARAVAAHPVPAPRGSLAAALRGVAARANVAAP